MENTLTPGNTLLALNADRDPTDPNVGRVQADSLIAFSKILKDNFNYETGRYESWGGDNEINNKILLKLDWNISKNHKFTIRYNYSEAKSQSRPSSSGDATPSINGGRHARTGGMSYENSQYYNSSKLHSLTAELNSRFGQLSNKLLVAYTKYTQPRSTTSSNFPFIDIMSGTYSGTAPNLNLTGDVYMSAGYELFSYKNNVDNNTLIITDNLTYQLNNHTFTYGISYEQQYFANSYLRQGSGYYRFKNLQSFQNYLNKTDFTQPFNELNSPIAFAYTYPINGRTNPVAELTFGQFATYLQDEFNLLDNLKITAGLRLDLPMYFGGAIDNAAVKGYTFNGGESVDLSTWPDAKLLWSPRLGFSWDVLKDRLLKVRGGTGVFTGRIPFVWFTNQPTNSGMIQYQYVVSQGNNPANAASLANRAILARIPFKADASELLADGSLQDIFPQANPVGGRIAAIAKDFKLPQVWRTSVSVDIKLPLSMLLTLEGIYTKDINSINFKNINLVKAGSALVEGTNKRQYWRSTDPKYTTSPYQNVVLMVNTDKGRGYTLAATLDLPKMAGFSGLVSYSKSWGEEVTGKSGSDPFSAWQYRLIVNSSNWEELGLTYNNTPHRIVGTVNYSIDYFKFFGSTISFFFNAYKGDAYSYIYSGDANGDGTSNDLMYIPKNASEFVWSSGADAAAYFAFQAQDPYLSKHQGEYAYRNSAYNPWNKRLDMRFMQDFKIKAGNSMNTLELSIDIINFMNLLNSNWGLNKSYVTSSPIIFGGQDLATGKPKASMRKIGGQYVMNSFQDPSSVAGTYGIQLGVRYLFN